MMNDKIKRELNSLNFSKRETEGYLEEARTKTIELIQKADTKTLCNLEDYTSYSELRKYSRRLEEIEAKIRTINYIIEE